MSSEAATPAVAPAAATPEATPAPATPAPESTPAPAPAATPANSQPEEQVTLDKTAHDQLVKDAARASSAQSSSDRYKGILQKNGLLGGGHFKSQPQVTPPTPEERAEAMGAEDQKAEKGLMALALDPEFREVIDKDPTLRDLLVKNPLAVLPILAPDAMDAEDAINLVKDVLTERKKSAAAPANLPDTPVTTPETPPTPPAVANPADSPVNEEVEAAKKIPNTEGAIAGMIKARLKSGDK